MAAAGGLAAAVVAAVCGAAALPMLAAGAYADCYDYCFKDCISKDRSMRDYCSYACDKTCAPDAAAPLAGDDQAMACQLDCVKKSSRDGFGPEGKGMEACYERCCRRCEAGSDLPRPVRAGKGAVRPAALPDHPFHEKQDTVRPAALPDHPFHEKQDAVRPAALPDHPFHEKQDAVRPAALPDHPFHEKQDAVRPAALPDHPFHEKQDAVGTEALPGPDDGSHPALGPVLP